MFFFYFSRLKAKKGKRKNGKKAFFFFRPKETTGPARAGKKKIEKFWPDELPARQPDRHRARIAGDPARPSSCLLNTSPSPRDA